MYGMALRGLFGTHRSCEFDCSRVNFRPANIQVLADLLNAAIELNCKSLGTQRDKGT